MSAAVELVALNFIICDNRLLLHASLGFSTVTRWRPPFVVLISGVKAIAISILMTSK